MTIYRQGSYFPSYPDEVHNNHFFNGKDNDLVLTHTETFSFTCDYKMAYYPFDTQKCTLIFVLMVICHISGLCIKKCIFRAMITNWWNC